MSRAIATCSAAAASASSSARMAVRLAAAFPHRGRAGGWRRRPARCACNPACSAGVAVGRGGRGQAGQFGIEPRQRAPPGLRAGAASAARSASAKDGSSKASTSPRAHHVAGAHADLADHRAFHRLQHDGRGIGREPPRRRSPPHPPAPPRPGRPARRTAPPPANARRAAARGGGSAITASSGSWKGTASARRAGRRRRRRGRVRRAVIACAASAGATGGDRCRSVPSSTACGAKSATRPCSSTRMASARTSDDSRCDTTIMVRPRAISARLAWMIASLSGSSALVASSRISSGGRVSSARAMAMRWRWPPEKLARAFLDHRVEAHAAGAR